MWTKKKLLGFGDYRLTILDDHYDHARNMELVETSVDERIEERLERLPIDQRWLLGDDV